VNFRALRFQDVEEEVRFLRGLLSVQQLADEVLEDCLERQLGLISAADVFLSQCARMIHASGGFLQILGVQGPVVTRVWGIEMTQVHQWTETQGALRLPDGKTLFVAPLNLGKTILGSLGFVLPGEFENGSEQVQVLVSAVAEMFDSAVLSFLALAEGHTALERLDSLNASGDFRPRARIGKYELLHPLGTGGMAQVMVARTVAPGGVSRLVALKRILPKLADDEVIVQQFLDEARLGLRLNHQNLVTFYDFGSAAGTYFMAMELIRGVDFDNLIYWPHGPLPHSLVCAVIAQALDGIHAAHEMRDDAGASLQLVHRDLSPHNIMVGFDGRVKVLDFGVAKMKDQRTVTLPGIVKGKPLYMSPEQATAERLDRRSDIFSMGLILYEALTGTRAFDKKDDTKSMESIVNDALPRHPSIPVVLWDVLEQALKKFTNERFQTAAQMAQALREVVPAMSDKDLSLLVTKHFQHRVIEIQKLEETKNRLAQAQTVIRT
jgi:eukaryotic-like serine/threonine-protein kinase